MAVYTLAPHLAALVENANGGFRMSQAMRGQSRQVRRYWLSLVSGGGAGLSESIDSAPHAVLSCR